jgi:replication fork protection complex subunit Tof1/Swi1
MLQQLIAISVIRPASDEIRTATWKNAKLKLLMTLCQLERLGAEDKPHATWIVPSALTSAHLEELQSIIEKYLETPWTDVSGVKPEDLLRRVKTITTAYAEDDEPPRDAFIDDSEGSDHLEDFMFPDNVRSKSDALDELRKKPKKRKLMRKNAAEPLPEDELDERRKAREQAALDRRRKIKSELYIRDSDEEMDEEENRAFFAREEENRKKQAQRVLAALSVGRTEESARKKRKSEGGDDDATDKRRRQSESEDERMDDDEEDEMEIMGAESDSPPQQRAATSDDDLDVEDTPVSSQSQASHAELGKDAPLQEIPQPRLSSLAVTKGKEAEDSDDELPTLTSQRRRVRAGFILDDSDED